MTMNAAIRQALTTARLKYKLAQTRRDACHLACAENDYQQMASNMGYLEDTLTSVIQDYVEAGEQEQADRLRVLNEREVDDAEEYMQKFDDLYEFFYDETNVYKNLVDKYSKMLNLKTTPTRAGMQLYLHGSI